jgi:molybdopterin-guanine dinucleotide biosynthesis protein A
MGTAQRDRVRRTDLPDATGVVLAGGRSTRFGRDKLAEPYLGSPLLHHAVLRLADVCGEVVVVISPRAPEPALPVGAHVRVARDVTEGDGPVAGVYAGLLVVTSTFAIVSGGDMPDLQTPVLVKMLDVAETTSADAVALTEDELVRPLPCVVRAERAIEVAHTLLRSGRRSVHDLLDALHVTELRGPTWHALDPEKRTLFDIDEPKDLFT